MLIPCRFVASSCNVVVPEIVVSVGVLKGMAETGHAGVQSVKGTPFWMAPEVLQVRLILTQEVKQGWLVLSIVNPYVSYGS